MRTKITALLLALACAAAISAATATPAKAATLGHATLAGKLDLAKIGAPAAAGSERFQVWNVGYRHRRRHRHRHHRRNYWGGSWGGFGFAPLWGLALSQRHGAPPPVPAWQFDGYRWVCNYVDAAGRPLCR